MKITKSQKWFLLLDFFFLLLLVKGFMDTFIRKEYSWGWFVFSLFIVIIFNIVEFPREEECFKKKEKDEEW